MRLWHVTPVAMEELALLVRNLIGLAGKGVG